MKAQYLCVALLAILVLVGCNREEEPTTQLTKPVTTETEKHTYLLFVKIPDPIMPLERGEKYEDPLNSFLISEGLGGVSGGGSMLSEPDASGKRSIAWVGLDVDVYDPDKAMPRLIKKLKEIGVPAGTEIEQSQPIARVVKVE